MNSHDAQIESLLSKMTLEEKAGQMSYWDWGPDFWGPKLIPDAIRRGEVGCVANVFTAPECNEIQRIARKESRLGIPLLIGSDVIHGFRTIFPIPLAEAASFNPGGAQRAAAIAAREAAACGINWIFAPMVDLARDPRWGRIAEGAGEDPFLACAMAAARTRGSQQWDDRKDGSGAGHERPRTIACVKHFAAYGAAEGGRDYNTADISEHTLREMYLPPFKAAFDAGVGTTMASFNELAGIPATASHFLQTKVLRDEWKFDGICVSDYLAIAELMEHGVAGTPEEAVELALRAGIDMDMQAFLYLRLLPGLVRSGKIPVALVDEAVRRVLRIKFRMNLFEKPFADESREASTLLHRDHLDAALQVGHESIVLLKNDGGVLPLKSDIKRLAVIGTLADDAKALLGSWACQGKPEETPTIATAIRQRLAERVELLADIGGVKASTDESFDGAVDLARRADAVVLILGETAIMSGEAHSRTSIDLPARQQELLEAVDATGKPIVLVLLSGRPLSILWASQNVDAIVQAWQPGSRGADAIADVLFGDVNPSAKLPVSVPRSAGQIPINYNHKRSGRPRPVSVTAEGSSTAESMTMGYIDSPNAPIYPFGHGLSYTRYEYANLQLSSTTLRNGERIIASAEVKNAGQRAGVEIVQLYIRDVVSFPTRPAKELKGFQRVSLDAGEAKRVEFQIDAATLAHVGADMKFVTDPGAFKLWIGPSSAEGLEGSIDFI